MSKYTLPLVALADLPTDDLLGFCPDKMFLVRCQDAEGELLPCAGLPIHHICALVHVDGALREGGGLQVQNKSLKRGGVRSHSHQQYPPLSFSPQSLQLHFLPTHPWWGRSSWTCVEDTSWTLLSTWRTLFWLVLEEGAGQ